MYLLVFASKIKVAVGVVGSGQAVHRPGQMLHMYELGIEQGCELFLHCTCISNSSVICLYAHYCEKSSQFETTSNDDIGSFWLES